MRIPLLLLTLASLVLHEAAHAFVADRRGDPLPRALGRVTLDPLAHLDVTGSLIVPVCALVLGLPPVGWGRTVRIWRADLAVFAAGPAVNLALAALLYPFWPAGALVNLALAGFNLLPIPGLDGGRILAELRRGRP